MAHDTQDCSDVLKGLGFTFNDVTNYTLDTLLNTLKRTYDPTFENANCIEAQTKNKPTKRQLSFDNFRQQAGSPIMLTPKGKYII